VIVVEDANLGFEIEDRGQDPADVESQVRHHALMGQVGDVHHGMTPGLQNSANLIEHNEHVVEIAAVVAAEFEISRQRILWVVVCGHVRRRRDDKVDWWNGHRG
jgi:hypothetical protein